MIRLYWLTRIYIVMASLYYAWYMTAFALSDKLHLTYDLIPFLSVYWFLAVILYFYFRYIYLITFRRFLLVCGWSFINILLVNWLLQEIYFYFYYISIPLIPFSIFEVFRISRRMQTNISGFDANGEEFEIDEEEYQKRLKEEEEERARMEAIRQEDGDKEEGKNLLK
ncbi:MAG: hypothetical protein JST55_14230 [Bacteroidetes bacterium]|nr:hypothetical protein [Bacteroidota bacterium]